jgi:hypothetical protein
MSLLNRKPLSIGRAERTLRDDRVFVVATDDTYAPKQYFEHLALPRVKVVVLQTPVDSGLSAPVHVVDRLKLAFTSVKQRGQIQTGDEFWVLLDTDHYFGTYTLPGTMAALHTAQQVDFQIAISNPCFELWLLLHHADLAPGMVLSKYADVEQKLKETLGQYSKTSIKVGQFPLARVPDAIRRARALDTVPNAPWPQQTGTRVYLLMERVLLPGP